MIETKECSNCNQTKPIEQFEKQRTKCKVCISLQRAKIAEKKALEELNKIKPEPVELSDININEDDIINVFTQIGLESDSLTERSSTEKTVALGYVTAIKIYKDLIVDYRKMAIGAGNNKDKGYFLSKVETTNAKMVSLLVQLTKEFKLFTQLSKPIEDDPLYTPINFYLNTEVPQSSIVEPVFNIDPEHIQNLDGETND